MKTIKRLDFPLRVYFRDGECYHDSAVIVFTHGAPAYVRASGPFVVYPWENVKHIIKVADEAQRDWRIESDLTDERNENKQNAMRLKADLASMTEQRDVLKRQLEELRAETRGPALPKPKQVEPGGPIWVRVVDTTSKYFGLVGRLMGIEQHTSKGECWGVDIPDLNGKDHAWSRAEAFAVVGTGRQGPGPNEVSKPDTEHQQAQNRDMWRTTCLANGAKDCTIYFGPGDEVTIVVELVHGVHLDNITRALGVEHGLRLTDYKIRTVRPAFKHPADNGQP